MDVAKNKDDSNEVKENIHILYIYKYLSSDILLLFNVLLLGSVHLSMVR